MLLWIWLVSAHCVYCRAPLRRSVFLSGLSERVPTGHSIKLCCMLLRTVGLDSFKLA